MQKTYRYLANNKVVVLANLVGHITEYRPVYQKNLLVYRGIDNTLYFEFKNHDQKPLTISDYQIKFVAFDENKNMVLEKNGVVLEDTITRTTTVAESSPDNNLEFASVSGIEIGQTVTGTYIKNNTLVTDVDTIQNVVTLNKSPKDTVPLGESITFQSRHKRGTCTVLVSENDLLNVAGQYLSYSLYIIDSVGNKILSYADDHFGAKGTMEVIGDAFPGPLDSYEVNTFVQDAELSNVYYSETIDAQPAINGNSAIHTAAIYTDAFVGDVTLQGTLENQVTLNTYWADIDTQTFTGTESEPIPVNFNGVYSYIRVKTSASPVDKVTKILIRN